MRRIPVAYSTSHTFIMPVYVSIKSLLEASKDVIVDLNILICDNVTEEDKKLLSGVIEGYNATVRFVQVTGYFDNGTVIRGILKTSYYRLLVPWLLPEYDKVALIDGDTIVRESVSAFFDAAIGDYFVWGVRTPGFVTSSNVCEYIYSLNLDPFRYINAGNLIINCKLQREFKLIKEYLKYENNNFIYIDQDIINIVCKDRIGFLPLKFNFTPNIITIPKEFVINHGTITKDQYNEAFQSPAIIHYAGPKPWETKVYGFIDWWTVYRNTIFFNYAEEYKFEKILMVPPKYSLKLALRILLSQIKKKIFCENINKKTTMSSWKKQMMK